MGSNGEVIHDHGADMIVEEISDTEKWKQFFVHFFSSKDIVIGLI